MLWNCGFVDVLVAVTPVAVAAAKRATSTIPTVFIIHPNPVEAGIVASLARPGGNITGLSNLIVELSAKQIELLREIILDLKRIAVMVMPSFGPAGPRFSDEATAAAKKVGIDVVRQDVLTPDEFEAAFSELRQKRVQALLLAPTSIFFPERERIARLALENGLPTVGINEIMVRSGLLLWYGPNFQNLFRQAALYVDRILKGASLADLPVQRPTKLELVINLASAKALGIALSPAILARADEVIE